MASSAWLSSSSMLHQLGAQALLGLLAGVPLQHLDAADLGRLARIDHVERIVA